MIQRKPAQAVKPSTLTQQQSDFTAEGSPPPGHVAAAAPLTAKVTTALTASAPARPARKGPPVGSTRWQR